MTISFSGTSGLTFPDNSTQATAATGFGFKNRIINGAMMIDQRNAGASVTANGNYTLDRWVCPSVVASKYTVQQSTTAPVGFVNSLLVTSSSAYSVGASEYFLIQQFIEGTNISDLAWGTADAKTVTLSFWVRSSLTGVFGGAISGGQYYPFTYTINSANTWEQKSVTIPGSTSGTWDTNTSRGIGIRFSLGTGSTYSGTAGAWSNNAYFSATGATSVVGTNGATFYITGVQLEKGSTATSFDYRPYGTELALCQRYCVAYRANNSQKYFASGQVYNGTTGLFLLPLPVTARASPSSITVSAASDWGALTSTAAGSTGSTLVYNNSSEGILCVTYSATASVFTAGSASCLYSQPAASNAYIITSMEL